MYEFQNASLILHQKYLLRMSLSGTEHINTANRYKLWCHSGTNVLTSLLTEWRSDVHHLLLSAIYESQSQSSRKCGIAL